MDVSPEGALFVAGSEDGTLRIGETESGRITVRRDVHSEQGKCGVARISFFVVQNADD